MGLFEKLFPKTSVNVATGGYLQTLNMYTPQFTSFQGGLYEADLCRSAIHCFANHCAKLKPEVTGKREKKIKKMLLRKPNPWMDTYKFLYTTATILECENTVFLVPLMDSRGESVLGIYPTVPSRAKVLERGGREYIEFQYPVGTSVVERERVGILTKFQYKDTFFGSQTNALKPTLEVIHTQNEGIVEGVKSSASVRFLAMLAQTLKPSDIEEEKARFVRDNLSINNGGVMMVDTKYSSVQQINSQAVVIDPQQMEAIKKNVFNYFGCNENILQNNYTEDQWAAYYEGKIEPFAIQLSLVLTNMLHSDLDSAYESEVVLSANRLQYASNTSKLNIVTQLFDRGMMTLNQGLEVFNMPPIEDGDKRYIRKEYAEVDKLNEAQGLEEETDDDKE